MKKIDNLEGGSKLSVERNMSKGFWPTILNANKERIVYYSGLDYSLSFYDLRKHKKTVNLLQTFGQYFLKPHFFTYDQDGFPYIRGDVMSLGKTPGEAPKLESKSRVFTFTGELAEDYKELQLSSVSDERPSLTKFALTVDMGPGVGSYETGILSHLGTNFIQGENFKVPAGYDRAEFTRIELSPDGRHALTLNERNQLNYWDCQKKELISSPLGANCLDFSFLPDNRIVILTNLGIFLCQTPGDEINIKFKKPTSFSERYVKIAINPSADYLFALKNTGQIEIFSIGDTVDFEQPIDIIDLVPDIKEREVKTFQAGVGDQLIIGTDDGFKGADILVFNSNIRMHELGIR